MKILIAFLVTLISIAAQSVWLGSPAAGDRMVITAGPGTATVWSAAATVSFDVDSVQISQGDHIWCSGVQGNPNANGHHLVRSISGNTITLENLNHSDLPAYPGTKIDVDVIALGLQLGYCHRLGEHALNPSPRLAPKVGTALYNEIYGVGGLGSATGTLDRNSPQYLALIARANTASSPNCNGVDAATCPTEEGLLNGGGAIQTAQGDAALLTGFAFSVTGNTRYRNSAIYYLRNIERIVAVNPAFSAADMGASGGGRGEDGEYASWLTANWAVTRDQLADLEIPGVWDATQKALLRKKLFENKVANGCVNPLGSISGEMTLVKGSNQAKVTDGSFFTVGQWIYVKTRQNKGKISDGSLLQIVVVGNIATATLKDSISNIITSTPVKVTGSGISGFDGVWFTSATAGCDASGNNCPKTISFTVSGVPAGTYTTPGMEIFAYYNVSGSSGEVFRITGKPDSTTLTLNANSGYHGVNSPWGPIDTVFHENTCSVSELAASHAYSPGYNDRVVRLQLAVAPDATTTTFKANAADVQNFRNVPLPIAYQYYGEMGDVVAVDFITGDVTVAERGKYSTVAYNHNGAPGESRVFVARRHGWDGSAWTLQGQAQTGALWNLLTRKNAPQIRELLAFAHESQIAREDIELIWNYMYDTDFDQLQQIMTGLSPGGSTSGYHGGTFGAMLGGLAEAFKYAISPPIDLLTGKKWLEQMSCWVPYASIPWAMAPTKPYHVQTADDGFDYFFEQDDWAVIALNNHFSAGTNCQKWGYDFMKNQIRFFTDGLNSVLGEELLWHLVHYTNASTPIEDFRTAPLGYFFNQTNEDSEPSRKFKALSSRTSWNDTDATLWWNLYIDGGTDHMGAYNVPGAFQAHKNTALMMPGVKGGNTGNDARNQNGLRFARVAVSNLGGGDNELMTYSLRLSDPAPANGVKVDFSTDSPFIVPPGSIVVPAGVREMNIPVLAYQTTPASLAHLTAASANAVDWYVRAGNLSGSTSGANRQALLSLACYPFTSPLTSTAVITSATGGTPARCTVTLAAAAGSNGTQVDLSVNLAGVSVPASIRVRNGKTKGSFFVTLQPSTSGSLTVTATSTGSVSSDAIAVTPIATPETAQVAAVVGTSDSNGQLDNATGGLGLGNSVTKVDKYKIDSTMSYTLADASAAYNPANANLTAATKTFLHLRRPGGRDAAIIYDNITLGDSSGNTATGAQPIMLDSFYRGCVCPNEFVNNSPATQQTKSGNVFTFRKGKQTGATFGGDAMMTMVAAYTNGRIGGDFLSPAAGKFSADVITYGNPTGTTESFRVYLPAASVTDTPPEVSNFSPTGYRGVVIKETSPYVAALKIDPLHTINSLAFSVSFTGTGDFVLDGWEAGTYAIARNGVSVAEDVGVSSDGVLKFSSGSGAIQISQTGTVPPDPPPTDTLDLKVRAKGGAGIATIRSDSLDYQTSCDVTARNLASQVVATGSSATGPKTRIITLTGLAGGTNFNAAAGCGLETGSTTFTSESVSGNRAIAVEMKRPIGVDSIAVEFGTTAELGSVVFAACSGSSCKASLPALPRGAVYFVKVNMRDASAQTTRASGIYRLLQ